MPLSRPDLESRLASAARALRSRCGPSARVVAAHLDALLASVQEGPVEEGPRAVGDVLDEAGHPEHREPQPS